MSFSIRGPGIMPNNGGDEKSGKEEKQTVRKEGRIVRRFEKEQIVI